MLGGVAMLVLAYGIAGLVGGKKEEHLIMSKREDQWSVCLAAVSWGRVYTSSTVYSLRRDVIARVGQQVGRKITAYAVYMFVEGELLNDGSRNEVRIWSGNKQRAEQVCKTINRFFHGNSGKRGWKSIMGTLSSTQAHGQQHGHGESSSVSSSSVFSASSSASAASTSASTSTSSSSSRLHTLWAVL